VAKRLGPQSERGEGGLRPALAALAGAGLQFEIPCLLVKTLGQFGQL
jgi:hypothetical protein